MVRVWYAAAAVLFVAGILLVDLLLIDLAPARADDMPARKAGLWEVKTAFDTSGRSVTIRQCIDAATDPMMMSVAGPMSQAVCPRRDVKRSGDSVTIDSTCTFKDKTTTAHAVITGSLDSAYGMTVTVQGDVLPGGGMTMTVNGTWLGPCTAGQKPGDMIMPGGLTLNILELQKRAPSTGVPLPP